MSSVRRFSPFALSGTVAAALLMGLTSCGFFPGTFQKVVPAAPFKEWVKEALKEEHLSLDHHRMAAGIGSLTLDTGQPGTVYEGYRIDVDVHGITDPTLIDRVAQRVRRKTIVGHLQHHARLGFYLDAENENPRYLIRQYSFP